MGSNNKQKRFEEIYLSHFGKMKRFAKEFVVSEAEAENLVQDIFFDLWEKKDLLMNMTSTHLVSYLYTMLRNRSLNFLRHEVVESTAINRMKDESVDVLQLNLNSLEAMDEKLFDEENIEKIVEQALAQLPEKCRQIFIMNKLEGKKQKKIAEELAISVSTVESQMGIAYKKLRSILKNNTLLFLFLFS